MSFVIITVAIWILFIFLLYRMNKARFSFPDILLPLVLFSIIVTVDLGINYLAAAEPLLNDGIGVHGIFSFFIFGDDSWTLDLFKQHYYMSIKISFVLLLAYMAAYFFKPTQGNTTRNGRSIR